MGGQASKIAPITKNKRYGGQAEYFNASLNRYAGKANDNQHLILELLEVM